MADITRNTMQSMGTGNNGRPVRKALMRVILLFVAPFGILWPLVVLPSFWSTVPVREVSLHIMADRRFRPGVLDDVLARMKAYPRPALVQPEFRYALALVSLQAAEEAMQRKSPDEADREMEATECELRSVLEINPTDSFLWLMLYSVVTRRNGFDQENIRYLDRSYASGPNEGWVGLRRNQWGLAIFSLLSKSLQQEVAFEFAALVSSGFIEEAAINLTGVGWVERERLLENVTQVDIVSREIFAKRLARDGVKLSIPGVELDERLWR
ncbi:MULTISPECIES: hypothetical protein [unclassified Bradyrhizobium]|uniref:hypothetical protein n=1 Tax=unclassified Bradyrhizobium TaxID=2631580 RepID=UPI001FFB1063|nr:MULTISPECIES: hypothetical protein [unclassified Bradyrhizobium]MCK1536082.1 hypothetical protein [Bradyrhizobium sp. 176]MCK1557268.1 hypothetical protein [Bradyrhizobium sp. 171]